jgi:hypothetical protein
MKSGGGGGYFRVCRICGVQLVRVLLGDVLHQAVVLLVDLQHA